MKYSVTVMGIYSRKKKRETMKVEKKLPWVPLETDNQTKGSD